MYVGQVIIYKTPVFEIIGIIINVGGVFCDIKWANSSTIVKGYNKAHISKCCKML